MVSVKTVDETEDSSKKMEIEEPVKQQQSSRPSIDLVCVLDTSGSMSGYKLDNLKNTLLVLLDLLGENDRLSLVSFNSDS